MRYITTWCRNCGFKTRNQETGVPNVQLGPPISRCPKCGKLILDSIATEYEFMSDKERAKFTTKRAYIASIPGNIIYVVLGLILFVGGIIAGEAFATSMLFLFGVGFMAWGTFHIIQNNKMKNEPIIEQAVYESLQRTKNINYVKFIEKMYSANKKTVPPLCR